MPTEVIMPKVDMDMATGKIAHWYIIDGGSVRKGDPLFDIETDKAAMEVESPATGILRHLTAAVGAEVPIGTVIAWIYAEGEPDAPSTTGAKPPERKPTEEVVPAVPMAAAATSAIPDASATVATAAVRATPAARRLASQHGVMLDTVSGSGACGRIRRRDVEAQVAAIGMGDDAAVWQPQAAPLNQTIRPGEGMPVFMLHGFAGDQYTWAALEPLLPGRPLIRLELPGHGASPQRALTDFADLATQVVQAFDAAGLKRAHLLGHSLGGALATALAAARPAQVASLALLAPAGLGPAVNGPLLDGLTRANQKQSLWPWLRQLVADPALISADFAAAAMRARADAALRAYQRTLASRLFTDGTQCFDVAAALRAWDGPTRIVWGRDDAVVPWQQALQVGSRPALHLLPKVGHLPQFEAPELVAAILRDHWRGFD
jgi:pyruvate dehydrogenase E2 component (dihydrolipoamide acetyltransferase)